MKLAIKRLPSGQLTFAGMLEIAEIKVGTRLRKLDDKKVGVIKKSMEEVGLLNPISLRGNPDPDDETPELYILVAGLHRLEAARQSGHERILAYFIQDDESSLLIEIDENLCRAELSPAEVANHLKRRKELWEKDNSGKSSPTIPGRPKGFAADTAEATGRSKRSISQAVRRAEKIVPDVMEDIRGTDLDKGTSLDALANLTDAEQRQVVDEMQAGSDDSTLGPRLLAERNLKDMQQFRSKRNAPAAQLKRLKDGWNNATREVQEKFLKYINKNR